MRMRMPRLVLVSGLLLAAPVWAAEQTIRLNSQVVDSASRNTVAAVSRSAAVNNLFQEQKAFVVQILNDLGIPLSGLPPQVRERIETPQTNNFEAFVAYSMGLDYADQGRYAEARAAFSRSAAMDPNFQQAVRMERSTPLTRESVSRMVERSVRTASQRGNDLLSGRRAAPPPPPPPPATANQAKATNLQEAMRKTVSEIQTVSAGVATMVENIAKNPNSAPEQFRLATSRGVSPGMALETTLLTLDRPPNALVERVLGEAIQAGISVDAVRQVASQLRARGGCQ